MKIKNVVNGLPALRKLAGESLTPKTLYWVSKLLSKLDKELAFYNAERGKLILKFGEKTETGNYQVRPEDRAAFEKSMADLLNVEIEENFKVVKLPTSENVSLSYNDLQMLEGFVELDFVD